MKNIAIFASGSGSNAENISNYFADKEDVKIVLILTNSKHAYVLERAKKLNIPAVVFNRNDFYDTNHVIDKLISFKTDFIVLAGFLWLIPDNLIKKFPKRMVNIHPALLPKYGGKGMFGMKVHEAVKEANEIETGITIHYVNEKYDEGEIVFQEKVKIEEHDSPDEIAEKIHALEYEHFPRIIEKILKKSIHIKGDELRSL
jgi:phosphoribosylglycinamide formyltransferase 1